MRFLLIVLLCCCSAANASAEPANTIKAMFQKLRTCLTSVQLNSGSEATVRFMLRRDGSIIGTPRITYAKSTGDPSTREADAQELADGLRRCTPVEITEGLGGAIAGRMIVFSFGVRRAQEL